MLAVYPGIALPELNALMRAPRLAPFESESGDQAGERIGIRQELLQAFGASQRAGEAPDGVARLRRRGVEAPVTRGGRHGFAISGGHRPRRRIYGCRFLEIGDENRERLQRVLDDDRPAPASIDLGALRDLMAEAAPEAGGWRRRLRRTA